LYPLAPVTRDTSDPLSVAQAVTQRVGTELNKPDPIVLSRFYRFVKRWIETHLEPLDETELLSFDQWIEIAPYTIARKAELISIFKELKGHFPSRKQSARVNCFIKVESYPFENDPKVGYTYYKAARVIMSRSDFAKVIMGPPIHSIESKVYELKKPDGHPFFIKHVPVPDRYNEVNSIISAGSQYVITDYTSFEASFSAEIMTACECQLYRYMLKTDPKLANWICGTLTSENMLRFRNGTKARLKARRMSGDMCTSLGNGFTNLMLMLFAAEEQGFTCNGFVEGDDGVFAVSHTPDTSIFDVLGFKIKMVELAHPGLGGFCGVVAADNGNIKDPVKFLQTFGWTHSCLSGGNKVMHALLRAKALSGIYELPNCPIIRPLCDRALKLTTGVEPRFDDFNMYAKPPPVLTPPPFQPSTATRDLFAVMYGISPAEQLTIEEQLRSTVELSDTLLVKALNVNPEHDFNWSRYVSA
jgi:hypothetical protein